MRYRPTWVTVDLEAIRHNVRALKPAGAALMAVIKANAYGHGDVEVANAAVDAGAGWLGVALVEEGLRLRDAGVDARVLVLSEFPPGSEREALAARLTPTLYTRAGLERLAAAAAGEPIAVHVKVDTGMHRVGVWPPEDALPFVERVRASGLRLEGVFTHFARSEEDVPTTKEQAERFLEVLDRLRGAGHEPEFVHAANSGGTILHADTHFDVVRPGISIYGLQPGAGVGAAMRLRPALTWRSRVSMVKRLPAGERISYGHRYTVERDAWIATVPVGYADGYPRALGTRADALLGGRRRRVAGTVTMDQMMLDCGEDEVAEGDEVVLIGSQARESVTADELAVHAGTIGYEIVTRIGERVPREYVG
jgi:alanine racemase